MENQRYLVEDVLDEPFGNIFIKILGNDEYSLWRVCLLLILVPFSVLYAALRLIPLGIRLAVANADRVVFVLASSFLSFYQIPRKVFFIYISVLGVTGFLQILRLQSPLRDFMLFILKLMTRGGSEIFLRKFTSFHASNTFTRRITEPEAIYVPVGSTIPDYARIEVFDFPISSDLSFDKKIGACEIKVEALRGGVGCLYVNAPWGTNRVTFDMDKDNLGKFISYLNQVEEGDDCPNLICQTRVQNRGRALTISETINHFKSGNKLVKVKCPVALGSRYVIL